MTKNITMNMNVSLNSLGLDHAASVLKEYWDYSQRTYEARNIPFLTPGFVDKITRELSMPAEIRDAMISSLGLFDRLPALKRLFWHAHVCLTDLADDVAGHISTWPSMPLEITGNEGAMFYPLVFLSCYPSVREADRKAGIDKEITLNNWQLLAKRINEYHDRTGHWGLNDQLNWVSWLCGRALYTLGRLQFQPKPYKRDYHAFRNCRTKQVVVLAGNGMKFRSDGCFSNVDFGVSPKPCWTASYDETMKTVRGYPIDVRGRALNRPLKLSRSLWMPILKHSDPVLFFHIPGGKKMDFEECGESIAWSIRFFRDHFPDFKWKGFMCESWFLNSQLEKLLRPDSNIVRMLRELYLVPLAGTADMRVFKTVFGRTVENRSELSGLPRNTSLQRAVLQHYAKGGRLRGGGCLLFREEALRWGDSAYRTYAGYRPKK